MKSENAKKILIALLKQENWRPNFTKISKDTGVPITSVHDFYKRESKKGRITTHYVKLRQDFTVKQAKEFNEQLKNLERVEDYDVKKVMMAYCAFCEIAFEGPKCPKCKCKRLMAEIQVMTGGGITSYNRGD